MAISMAQLMLIDMLTEKMIVIGSQIAEAKAMSDEQALNRIEEIDSTRRVEVNKVRARLGLPQK